VNARAAELIERLHLRPHPEGGFYAEVHRSQGDYSLVACMVAPGFDFHDFVLMAADDPLRAWIARAQPALNAY
jgi:predicted cupin superfamily sugar epimerase